jgi:signal transduction histidine kinase
MERISVKTVFWFLVIYLISSLLWWTYEHLHSNEMMFELQKEQLQLQWKFETNNGNHPSPLLWKEKEVEIEERRIRRTIMFITEGVVFLGFLLWGIFHLANSFVQSIALKRRQNNFLLSVTHEFKTPLAGIKLLNQTLLKRELQPDLQRELLLKSNHEVARLSTLIDQVLEAARLDASFQLEKERINLSTIVAETIEGFSERFEEGEFEMEKKIQAGIFIQGNELAIRSILSNLLDNSMKYGGDEKFVGISLETMGDHCLLKIFDKGIGISEDEKEKLFQMFYRIGSEETRSTQGTGLGLFLVHRLVKFLGGSVEVRNNSPKGSIFEIRLPKV